MQYLVRLMQWIRNIAALWGAFSFVWFILSHLNIAPFYEVKLIPKNSVEPFINVFSGQDVQLDFNRASYVTNSEIKKVDWNISGGNLHYHASGLRPIIELSDSYEGIYNLSLKISLQNDKILTGKANIYVVQEKINVINQPKTLHFKINKEVSNFVALTGSSNTDTLQVEVYSDNNKWIHKAVINKQGNYFLKLKPRDQIKTINDKIIIRYKSTEKKSYNYLSVPEN